MFRLRSLVPLLVGFLLAAPFACASLVTYSAYAQGTFGTGSNVTVGEGWLGVNTGLFTLGGGSHILTANGGAGFTSGTSIVVSQNLLFNSDVFLGGNASVAGDVDSGGNITAGSSVHITGTATASGTIDAGITAGAKFPMSTPDVFAVETLPSVMSLVANGSPLMNTASGTLNVTPGSHGPLSTGTSVTVNFTAGTYYIDSLAIGGSNTVNFDTSGGPINIFIVGAFSTGSNTDVFVDGVAYGSASAASIAKIYMETGTTWALGGGSQWVGTVLSGGNLTTGSNGDLRGQYLSRGNLFFGGGTHLDNLILSDYLTSVPEPATLWLSGAGLAGLWLLRRRRAARG